MFEQVQSLKPATNEHGINLSNDKCQNILEKTTDLYNI